MEDATQALLIAGGILLAILTLTGLVVMFNNVSIMENANEQKKEAARLAEWNAEWEAYNKKLLYGAEVLTVINKAEQNNREYNNNKKHTVEIKVLENGIPRVEINEDGAIDGKEYIEKNKISIFKCNTMEISSETGKIKKIEFEFVE